MGKYKQLLNSRKFQIATVDLIIFIIGFYTAENFQPVIDSVNIWLTAVLVIGVGDGWMERASGNKK